LLIGCENVTSERRAGNSTETHGPLSHVCLQNHNSHSSEDDDVFGLSVRGSAFPGPSAVMDAANLNYLFYKCATLPREQYARTGNGLLSEE